MPPTAEFVGLPLEAMEHGLAKPIARIQLDPDQLSKRLGIRFVRSQDHLDDLDAALISTQSGRQFALIHHEHQPLPGTDIIVNERSKDPTADLIECLDVLSISPDELSWIHPDIDRDKLGVSHSLKNLWASVFVAVRAMWYLASRGQYLERRRAILIIENEYLRRAVFTVLRDLGHNVSEASDWNQAQRMLLQGRRGVDRIVADNPPPKGFRLPAKASGRTQITVVPESTILHGTSVSGYIPTDFKHSR
jgi:hypothetical protein